MTQYGLLPPQSGYGLLGYDEKQARLDAFLSGLGNTSAALLAAGAPSTDPGNFGRNMAQVAPGFAQGFQGSMQNSRNRAFQDMQAQVQQQQMAAQKQQMEREQQAQLARDRYINSVTMPNGPTNKAAQGQNTPMGLLAQAAPEQFIQASVQNAMTPPKPISASDLVKVPDGRGGYKYAMANNAVGMPGYEKPDAANKVTPYTDLAKLNADLKSGLITKADYDVRVASLGKSDIDWNKDYTPTGDLTPQGIRKRIEPDVETAQNLLRYSDAVQEGVRQAIQDGNSQAALAAMIQFQKAIDDGAVVREGDIQLARSAQSISQRLETMFENAKTGQPISNKMLTDMVSAMNGFVGKSLSRSKTAIDAYLDMADSSNYNRHQIVPKTIYAKLFMESPGDISIPKPPEAGTVAPGSFSGMSNEEFMSRNPFNPASFGGRGR